MALVSNGIINPDMRDRYGSTRPSIAARNSHAGVVRALLATARVDADSQDKFGRTPLWRARMGGGANMYSAITAQFVTQLSVCFNSDSQMLGRPSPEPRDAQENKTADRR